MNNETEIQRLSDAVAAIASTISEIINTKLKMAIEMPNTTDAVTGRQSLVQGATEGWVGLTEVMQHLKVCRRTVNTWMKKGWLPCIRIGRSVRFKLSQADEALNRRHGSQERWRS
jgi:excisionase family DNA binding protein